MKLSVAKSNKQSIEIKTLEEFCDIMAPACLEGVGEKYIGNSTCLN